MSTDRSAYEGLRGFDYCQVDVFAERALEGNMLGIFPDGRGLAGEEMQALARETNLSETVFIMPGDVKSERADGVRARIFTVEEELPFAGHPTLGTASWLYWNHPVFRGSKEISLALTVGKITVGFEAEDGWPGVFGTMRQPQPVFGKVHDPVEVAGAIGLAIEDLDQELPAQTVSTGMPICIVPLASVAAAGRLRVTETRARGYLDSVGAKFFYCMTRAERAGGADWHARMQFYGGEDPATGSAAGCAIAYLVKHGVVPSDEAQVIEQGIEIRRRSRIHVRAVSRDGSVSEVFVGGRTIPVASGRFFLP